ncbi:MAG: hypothetical protein ACRC0M_10995 [Legionella sp.]
MNSYINFKQQAAIILLAFIALSASSYANSIFVNTGWNGPVHHHSDVFRGYPGYGWGGGGYYRGGPNVIINVPVERYVPPYPYYVRECENIQVCNDYDECWLERYCH